MGTLPPSDLAILIRRVLLIANPASRHGRRLTSRAKRTLRAHGVSCDVTATTHPGHAADVAVARGADYDAVFTLGGDGTAMDVAGALAGTGWPVGVLAGGTGNLLARALGIPLNVKRAIPSLLAGDVVRVDLGRLSSGRRFAIAGGVGIDATMVAETPTWLKRRLGVLAYAIVATRAALGAVMRSDDFRVRITVDGVVYERQAVAVMIANFGAVLNDLITFGPGIRCDDGMLDVCIFSPRTIRDAVRIMWRLLRKDFSSDDCVFYRRGKIFRLETVPPRQFQADGELLCMTPVDVVIEPLAAHLLVPRSA